MPPRIVDLNTYRTSGTLVFAGRDRGQLVRAKSDLDTLDNDADVVEIRIPQELFAVTSSFFLGMFAKSIQTLGDDGFRRRYLFVGKDITRVVDDGIREALRKGSPL